MKKYLIKIIREALWDVEDRINDHKKMNLNNTSDLAQLIIDSRNNNLTLRSRDFLMRMNIHPDEFLTKEHIK
jgi:hypothetical protein